MFLKTSLSSILSKALECLGQKVSIGILQIVLALRCCLPWGKGVTESQHELAPENSGLPPSPIWSRCCGCHNSTGLLGAPPPPPPQHERPRAWTGVKTGGRGAKEDSVAVFILSQMGKQARQVVLLSCPHYFLLGQDSMR